MASCMFLIQCSWSWKRGVWGYSFFFRYLFYNLGKRGFCGFLFHLNRVETVFFSSPQKISYWSFLCGSLMRNYWFVDPGEFYPAIFGLWFDSWFSFHLNCVETQLFFSFFSFFWRKSCFTILCGSWRINYWFLVHES